MDFGWPAPPTGAGGACSDLNLLQDGLLIDLDDKTLQVGRREPRGAPNGTHRPRCRRRRQPATTTRLGGGRPCPCALPTAPLAVPSAAVPDGRALGRLCHLHFW